MTFPFSYSWLEDFIYNFVCNGEVPDTRCEKLPGWVVEYINRGEDGSNPSIVFSTTNNMWKEYKEFFYCRESREIVGFKHDCWKIVD